MSPSRIPHPGPVRNVDFPVVPEAVLSNGLRVLVVADHRLPQVSAALAFDAGRISNPAHNQSLVQLALELLKEGTQERSSREIADYMDQWAIHYEVDVLMEYSLVSFRSLSGHLDRALGLMAELVRFPTFPDTELAKAKVRWKSYLMSQRADPHFLAQERTFRELYPDHPYSWISVRSEDLAESTSEALGVLYRERFSPRNTLFLVAGPVSLDSAVREAERWLGDWEPVEPRAAVLPPIVPLQERRLCLVHRPHSVQARILVSTRTLPRAHPEEIPLKLTNQIFGGGASARLFLNLREDKGYTYGAYSQLKLYRNDGLLLAGADVKTETVLECVQEIFKELRLMQETVPETADIERSRSEIIGSFLRQMETPGSIGTLELVRRLYHLPDDYYQTFIPALRRVTGERVQETARRFLDPDRALITVVGDAGLLAPALKSLGPLRIFDTMGNPLEESEEFKAGK